MFKCIRPIFFLFLIGSCSKDRNVADEYFSEKYNFENKYVARAYGFHVMYADLFKSKLSDTRVFLAKGETLEEFKIFTMLLYNDSVKAACNKRKDIAIQIKRVKSKDFISEHFDLLAVTENKQDSVFWLRHKKSKTTYFARYPKYIYPTQTSSFANILFSTFYGCECECIIPNQEL